MERIKGSRSAMEAATCRLGAALFLLSFLFVCGASAESPAPASPAELEALSSLISGKQAEQQAAWGELSRLEADQKATQARRDSLTTLAKTGNKYVNNEASLMDKGVDAAKFAAYAAQKGMSVTNSMDLIMLGTQLAAEIADAQNKLDAIDAQLKSLPDKIAALDREIEQLQATLNYSKDPLAADLANERARLRNLENQKPTKDDQGQLQREIDSERQRIKELEQQYQQSQPGSQPTTSGQSVQPQGSYAAPSSGFGASSGSTQPTGQQGQQLGYGPGPDTGSPQVPYGPILEGIQGSIGGQAGGKPGGG